MEVPLELKQPDPSGEQRASDELVKLIRKLRWVGMEEEVEKMQKELTLRRVPAADSVVACGFCETIDGVSDSQKFPAWSRSKRSRR